MTTGLNPTDISGSSKDCINIYIHQRKGASECVHVYAQVRAGQGLQGQAWVFLFTLSVYASIHILVTAPLVQA